jgi:acyl-coenzyme A synthetase/AMP-(fatty) acid ligase
MPNGIGSSGSRWPRLRDARYLTSYLCEHPGYYLTGDGGYLDDDGYLSVMGRIDDVINVAGQRLSTVRSNPC